ncbi:bifunctional copper resistance protein CopD/cytochrome c oxidase assembly protein [Phycicoccus sp. SLBN-51]|uniref:bifunctional copper resistance protein CopD/cytochrome c oxidase assembly protein n=1 Tax=Phycicoccus sp. SLBN-51 TaxID=2768447 RepID=UPI00114FC66A|nr:bifunctional copper resistance protein CopD/cytochrome c oxidase assembly protein [Phycicoccus sp. SLBN-51]TQJ49027.1 putative copper resistance protein D [Phycicoccus sp. SLBN-51]
MSSPSSTTASSRVPAAVLAGAAFAAVLVAAVVGGAAAPLAIGDPGAVVRWGTLLVRVVHDLAAAATVGLLLLAAFLTPETTRTNRRLTATRAAAVTAAVWAVAGLVGMLFTFASLAGIPLFGQGYLMQLTTFVWDLEVTRVAVISAAMAAVVAAGAAVARSRAAMAWLSLLAVLAVLPLALAGHAAGAANHDVAVNALAVHLVGVVVWVGGLLALAVMRPRLGDDLGVTVQRFSAVALWCFVAVALSGVQSAWIRLGSLGGLATAYGLLVIAKVTALVLLGYAGWRHRRTMAHRLRADGGDAAAFLRLVLGELVVMGVAVGVAVALARSAPPVPDTAMAEPSPAELLTGYPAPGPLTPAAWFTTWRVDWLWLTVALVMAGVYVAGWLRLRRRGDAWPVYRVVLWVLGWAVFAYATSGGPGVYGRVLFSAHMVMHMAVAMIVPLLLVPAAPITLALRALPSRPDKTWGPREVILQLVHSRYLGLLANPVVAAALFFFSLAIFYYSPLFDLALRTHTGHVAMMVHFLLSGYLFVWVLVGIDPGPKRWSPLLLVVILFATMAFHAFFGVVMTSGTELLAADFFTRLHLPWALDPLADQQRAGAIAWGVGEAPTLILALMVAAAWVRTDRAEAKRRDRQADRDNDAELAAYNAHLAELADRHRRSAEAEADRREKS